MAGPAVHKPAGRLGPSFGTATQEDLQPFLGVMQILHHEPLGTAFNNLLLQQLRPEDEVALAHVFDRFWQADQARVGTGAGLGLAIVAGIAAEHGGTATAANTPGGGALFTLRLPLVGSPASSATP